MSATPADLSPDGYSRFFVIIQLLERMYKNSNKKLRILDVGGCSPYLLEVLEQSSLKFDLTIIDILPQAPEIKSTYIQADITKADIPAGSYDVVVNTDVLEHIPPALKDIFVEACVRLAGDVMILAAPFSTEGVDFAEHLVNDFNKQLFRVGQDWLEEHFEFGKPSLEQTIKTLNRLKVPYDHFGTNNLYSWIASTHSMLIHGKLGLDDARRIAINQAYNAKLLTSAEFAEPSYRHFFVVYKDKSFQKRGGSPAAAQKLNPESLILYLHDTFTLIAERMAELKHEADISTRKSQKLEISLANEKLYSQKLNETLILQANEIRLLAPIRRVLSLRDPRKLAKAIKKRTMGK